MIYDGANMILPGIKSVAGITLPVANTTTRGIAREATTGEAQAGVTSGSAPAFITPEELASALSNVTNPFVTLNVGAVIMLTSTSGGTIGATATDVGLSASHGPIEMIAGGAFYGSDWRRVTVLPGTWELIALPFWSGPFPGGQQLGIFLRVA